MEEQELQKLRKEYESSGHTVYSFAELKEVEFWKMKYALQKGLNLKRKSEGKENPRMTGVGFKKVVSKGPIAKSEIQTSQIIIRTQGGLEIIIPI